MIEFHNQTTSEPPIDLNKAAEWLQNCLKAHDMREGEINYIFLTDNALLELNKEHLGHDYYTDVITFDYRVEDIISGDIYISVDRVQENARDYNATYQNELMRVMAHGLLHLFGYEDHLEEDREEMRRQEEILLTLQT